MSEMSDLIEETDSFGLRAICDRALNAAPQLDDVGRLVRASALRAVASALEDNRSEIVRTADAETALGDGRLNSELTRTGYQCDHFAEVLEEGSYLEVTRDSARKTAMGDQPELRRFLVPIGPVAVFGASNFPLAFSVPGGDTVAAIASGCPVVAKVHPSHPLTSRLCAEIMVGALTKSGLPEMTLQLVVGQDVGLELVQNSAIKAVAFTGSLRGGKALLAAIASREDPIPFYGELSSVNPIVVLPAAAKVRGVEIGQGLAASGTTSNGQLCTKPQTVYVPVGPEGDRVVEAMSSAFATMGVQPYLNKAISAAFVDGVQWMQSDSRIKRLAPQSTMETELLRPTLLSVSCSDAPATIMDEVFGPLQVVVRYTSLDELVHGLRSVPGSLTATMHAELHDKEMVAAVIAALQNKVGRFIFNGYPTGVIVSWGQNHGGPWPASTSIHTSVGASSIRRFLRPITFQSAPEWILPPVLRDDHDIPKRVDGKLVLSNSQSV